MKRHFGVFRDYVSVTQPQATITRTHVTINCLFELPKGSISKINPSPIRFERMRPKNDCGIPRRLHLAMFSTLLRRSSRPVPFPKPAHRFQMIGTVIIAPTTGQFGGAAVLVALAMGPESLWWIEMSRCLPG
jgi:hypothetical protein